MHENWVLVLVVRVFKYVNNVSHIRHRTVVRIATPTMFTYDQIVRLVKIVQEIEQMAYSISFVDRMFWKLVSFGMILYVVRFVYNSKMRYKRLIVAQRENRQLQHEIRFLRERLNAHPAAPQQLQVQRAVVVNLQHNHNGGPLIPNVPPQIQNDQLQIANGPPLAAVPLAMLVQGAPQHAVHGLIGQQIQRRSLKRALEHSKTLTQSLKQDLDQLKELESNHKAQGKTLEAQNAAAITVLTNGHKLKMSQITKEHTDEMDALVAGHALANLNPTSAQIEEQTTALHELHLTHSSAAGEAQLDFDTELSDLKVAHKKEASDLSSRQSASKRRFEDTCLSNHNRDVRQRY